MTSGKGFAPFIVCIVALLMVLAVPVHTQRTGPRIGVAWHDNRQETCIGIPMQVKDLTTDVEHINPLEQL